MHYLFILILWLIQFGQVSEITQTKSLGNGLDTVKTVAAIKATFAATETKRKTFSQFMPLKTEQGKLNIGYYEGTILKMITANIYGDSGKVEADEYLDGGSVVLVYAKVSEYENLISVNPRTKVKAMTENWYYFKNENLIKWVSGGKVVPAGSTTFRQKAIAYKAELSAHKKMFADMSLLNKIK